MTGQTPLENTSSPVSTIELSPSKRNPLSNSRRYSKRREPTGITDIQSSISKKRKTQTVNNSDPKTSVTNDTDLGKFSDNLNILFCNIDGIRTKWNDVAALTHSDHLICFNELNLSSHDSTLLSSKLDLQGTTKISALDHTSYDRKGKKIKIKRRKRKGFGTAIFSKIPNFTDISAISKDHELVYANLKLPDCQGLLITGYRSPSSRVEDDINSFYDTLDQIILKEKETNNFDFIVFVGDDNASTRSTSHYSRIAASKMLTIAEKHQMIDMIENINTRADRQPDSCFAYFNSDKVEIEVSALRGILKSDHEPLQIRIKKSKIVAEIPKYKTMIKRYQKVSDSELTERMEESLAIWTEEWTPKLNTINGKQLDKAANKFVEILNKVQSQCFTKKLKKVPLKSRTLDTETDTQIIQLRAKISKAAWQFKRTGNTDALRKVQHLNDNLRKVVSKAAKLRLQDDMSRQCDMERINNGKFWEHSGSILNKSSYQTSADRELEAQSICEKLDKLDSTFTNSNPNYKPNPNVYENVITAPKKYALKTDPKNIGELIENMPRIQKFVKKNHDTLKHPLSTLLRMIQKADHFPKIFKTSRCSIIGKPPKDRAIFALAPIPKIIETVIKKSFDDLKVEDGTIQMAYTKNRGTACCNLITLQEVEMCQEPTIQTLQDLVKAFNSTKHETIIEEAEKQFGAGKLISSWLTNRSYTFKHGPVNQTRGQNANQGVPAGTLIGVECFLLFIATVTSLTNKNAILLWAALYADDTSPLVKESNLIDFQKALDFSIEWGAKNNVKFHLSGDKAPTYLAYLKKGQSLPIIAQTLNLGGTPLKRVSKENILGLIRNVRSTEGTQSTLIDKYGYECEWDITKLKKIAYRLQHIRYDIVPEFMKKLVSAYFVGYMRFSSAVIFSRCSPAHLKTARYYYCMAMAASVGLNTAEALNLSCCKHMSVGKDNSGYKKLLKLTGLPSIREMACLDARSLIKQTELIRPQWFNKSVPRVSRSQQNGAARIIGVAKSCKGTILESVFNLYDEYISVYKPVRDVIFKAKQKVRDDFKKRIAEVPQSPRRNKDLASLYNERKISIAKLDTPILEDYFLARSMCTFKGVVDYTLLLRTCSLNSRDHFNCLDTMERFTNFKTPRKKVFSSPTDELSEDSPSPATPTRKRPSEQSARPAKRRKTVLQCDEWVGSKVFCKFCKVRLKIDKSPGIDDSESHLLYKCSQIPGEGPLPKNIKCRPRDRMRRLAEIAAATDPGGL